MEKYKVQVVYFYQHPKRTLHRNLTLEEAQAICGSDEGSSRTCTKRHLKKRTKLKGAWFLCYTEDV